MSFLVIPSSVGAAEGDMVTYPGAGDWPYDIAFDGTNMWTANTVGRSVTRVSPAGVMTTYSVGAGIPTGIAFDGTSMWAANSTGENSVKKISSVGTMTTYGGMTTAPWGIAFDGTNMWTTHYWDNVLTKVSPTGVKTVYPGPLAMRYSGIAFDGTNMWVTSSWGNSVTKVSPTGAMTEYSGVSSPGRIAFDGTNMWTANYMNDSVTKVSPTGAMTTYAVSSPLGIAFDGTDMWVTNYDDNSVTKISPIGVMTTYAGTGLRPVGIAFDGTSMWTANSGDDSVTKISTDVVLLASTLEICIDDGTGVFIPIASGGGGTFTLQQMEIGNTKTLRAFYDNDGNLCAGSDVTTTGATWNAALNNPNDAVDVVSGTVTAIANGAESFTVSLSGQTITGTVTVAPIAPPCSSCADEDEQHCPTEAWVSGCGTNCGPGNPVLGTRSCDLNWKEVRPGQ